MEIMTPRDRILVCLHHEKPDRIPVDGWFHPEVVELLKAYFQTDDWLFVEKQLGMNGWANLSPSIDFPNVAASRSEESVTLDPWGVCFRRGKDNRYQQWIDGPLVAARNGSDLLAYRFPSVKDVREPENYASRVRQLQNEGMYVFGEIENPYKRFWHLRGYQNALMDYLVNQEMLEIIYDRLYDVAAGLTLAMARAGVDMIKVVGDVAMNDRIIMGPDAWRRFDKPRLAQLLEDARAVNPDVVFFFHSDGRLTDLMDDLVEIGFTVINPIQPECMDPVEVKKRWGDRITLHGCISIQQTLPFGTVTDVHREVEHLIQCCGYNGGLILSPSNVIQPDTPLENILACYQAAQ